MLLLKAWYLRDVVLGVLARRSKGVSAFLQKALQVCVRKSVVVNCQERYEGG